MPVVSEYQELQQTSNENDESFKDGKESVNERVADVAEFDIQEQKLQKTEIMKTSVGSLETEAL